MRLPASVLGSLRLGLGATALLAGGCDEAPVNQLEAGLARVEAKADAQSQAEPASTLATEVAGLIDDAVEAVEAVQETEVVRERVAIAAPIAVERVAEAVEATAFVPFSEDPRTAAPIRPRIRTEPKPRPRTRPRPRKQPQEVSTWRPRPKPPKQWDGDQCPACGRG